MPLRALVLAGACLVMTAGAAPHAAAQDNPVAVIQTSMGDITVELFQEQAPLSVENFLQYANDGFYAGTIFHRVIEGFMIQGGGMTADMRQKPTRAAIRNEARNGLLNERGTLAMARTNVVDSATSQFFINHADNAFLNNRGIEPQEYGYAVFGRVTDGMDVVDDIATTQTGQGDVPVNTITITGVVVQ